MIFLEDFFKIISMYLSNCKKAIKFYYKWIFELYENSYICVFHIPFCFTSFHVVSSSQFTSNVIKLTLDLCCFDYKQNIKKCYEQLWKSNEKKSMTSEWKLMNETWYTLVYIFSFVLMLTTFIHISIAYSWEKILIIYTFYMPQNCSRPQAVC